MKDKHDIQKDSWCAIMQKRIEIEIANPKSHTFFFKLMPKFVGCKRSWIFPKSYRFPAVLTWTTALQTCFCDATDKSIIPTRQMTGPLKRSGYMYLFLSVQHTQNQVNTIRFVQSNAPCWFTIHLYTRNGVFCLKILTLENVLAP